VVVSTAGTYTSHIANAAGCDSTITTNLTVIANTTSTRNISICAGSTSTLPDGVVVSTAGTYTSHIANAAGCDSTITTNLTVIANTTSTRNISICAGSTSTLPDGVVVSTAGTYTSHIANAAGCDSTITTNLTVLQNTTNSVDAFICDGNSYVLPDGSTAGISGTYVSVIPNSLGCDSVITTTLTTIGSSSSITDVTICQGDSVRLPNNTYVFASGSYPVSISSSFGCDSLITTNVTVNPISTGSESATICSGDVYFLPDGSSATTAGIYTTILTNSVGCDSIVTTTLNVNMPSTATVQTTICAGSSVTLANGITVTSAGTYTTIIPNYLGCDSVITTIVNVVNSTSSTVSQTICMGDNVTLPDGSVVTPIVTGNYTTTLPNANANGCDSIITTHVIVKSLPTLITNVTQIRCFGDVASVIRTGTGGLIPYVYNNTPTASLAPGNYLYTVTDANGCKDSAQVTIDPSPATLTLTATPNQIQCFNGRGSVTLQGNGGTIPYSYSGSSQTNLTAGSYNYTVTDAHGCTSTASAVISPGPTKINATASATLSSCLVNTGTATATVSGGTPPYAYSWNSTPAQTTNPATALGAGTYVVTVSDSRGCTVNATAIVGNAAAPRLTLTGVQTYCPGSTTSICASAGMTSYAWTSGETTQCATFSAAGSYTVVVTNSSGCTASATANIAQGTLPVCSITGNDFICPGGSTTLTAPVGYTYKWSNASTKQFISVRTGGTYSVTIKNTAGCTSTCSKVVTAPLKVTVKNTNGSCANGFKGSSALTVTGGVPPYNYAWSNGATTATASGLNAGPLSVQVTDSKGCLVNLSTTIVVTKAAADYSRIVAAFNANDIAANNYIWFSAVVKVNYSGSYPVELTFTDQNIASSRFNVNPTKGRLVIDNTYTQTTTTYAGGEWLTTSPPSANGNYFISGYSYKAPTTILRNLSSITWKGVWTANKPGITTVDWKWSAAVYTNFNSDCSLLGVKPVDDANGSIYANTHPAGSPENYIAYVVPGARGLANGDYVGTYTSIGTRTPCANTGFGMATSRLSDEFSQLASDEFMVSAYPNPFSSKATIEFMRNDKTCHATIEVFNLSGQKVARLFDGTIQAGERYAAEFNGDDLAEGIYVYRIATNDKVINGRLILVK
jgi:hypothetical protein